MSQNAFDPPGLFYRMLQILRQADKQIKITLTEEFTCDLDNFYLNLMGFAFFLTRSLIAVLNWMPLFRVWVPYVIMKFMLYNSHLVSMVIIGATVAEW